MRHRYKLPLFYIIYLSLVLLACIAINIGNAAFKNILSEYETSQPKYLAEDIFKKYFVDADGSFIIDSAGSKISEYETQDNINRYIEGIAAEREITYFSSKSAEPGTLNYTVKADETKIGEFTIIQSEDKTKHGFKTYKAGNVKTFVTPTESVAVTIPENCTLYINGKTVDDKYITQSGIETGSCRHMPEGVKGLTFCTYKIDGFVYKPEVEVKDPFGVANTVSYDDKTDTFKASVNYNEELETEYSESLLRFAKLYAAYTQDKGEFSGFSSYMDPKSALYRYTKTLTRQFSWYHDRYDFSNVKIGEFYSYDENTFSCRISFEHNLYLGKQKYTDYVDTTFYLRNVDGKFLVYDSYNN